MIINSIIEDLLKKRNIDNLEEYLSDKPKTTYDPSLFSTMEKAVDLIIENINLDKKICIYGDYDTDGLTSTALLIDFFRKIDLDPIFYIPSRFTDGYGLNKDAIKKIKKNEVDLIITVDCGITGVDEVEYAKSLGIDVIITDHHEAEGQLPDSIIINPKLKNSGYPFPHLSGCGVAFKLVQALQRRLGLSKLILNSMLDLVAISTIADLVPLIGENRTLTKYGLMYLNKGRRKSFKIMLEKLGLAEGTVISHHIAYIIAPHINAAGRMADASGVVDFILSDDEVFISESLDYLIEQNKLRQGEQSKAFEICKRKVENLYSEEPILIIKSNEIHEGVAGIVAGKIKDFYKKPTIVLSEKDGLLKGSGRSLAGIDMYESLIKYKDIFEKIGGHAMACGMSIDANMEEEFRKIMREEFLGKEAGLDFSVDMEIDSEMVTREMIHDMNKMEPFGKGNERPVFSLFGQVSNPKRMGTEKQHISFYINDLECLYFNNVEGISDRQNLSLLGTPQIDNWKNKSRIKFIVKEII